jgi:hypothetical protein
VDVRSCDVGADGGDRVVAAGGEDGGGRGRKHVFVCGRPSALSPRRALLTRRVFVCPWVVVLGVFRAIFLRYVCVRVVSKSGMLKRDGIFHFVSRENRDFGGGHLNFNKR